MDDKGRLGVGIHGTGSVAIQHVAGFNANPNTYIVAVCGRSEDSTSRFVYQNCPNAKIDFQKEYLTTFYSSDFLITDISSIISEYFLTKKPIIYCHRTNHFNHLGSKMAEGFYWVHNWEELKNAIEMLKRGEDPLFEKRQQIIRDNFYINPNGAGNTIKEIIKKDFYEKN